MTDPTPSSRAARRLLALCSLCLCAALAALPARAQTAPETPAETEFYELPGPFRFATWAVQDARSLTQGWDTRRIATVAGVTGGFLLMTFGDETVSDELTTWKDSAPALYDGAILLEDLTKSTALRPILITLFAASLMADSPRLQDATFTTVEGVIFSLGFVEGLRFVAGRYRPDKGEGAHAFTPLAGGRAFPGRNAAVVMAAVVPWAYYYPGWPSTLLVAVGAAATIGPILQGNQWPTDVLAGALLGVTTARWLSRRHIARAPWLRVEPVAGGVGLAVRF